MTQELKYQNKVVIVGTVTICDKIAGSMIVRTTIDRTRGGDPIVHNHVLHADASMLADIEDGQRVMVQGKLLTISNEDLREIETVIQAVKIGPPPEGYADKDYSRAQVIGVLIRPADIFDRNPETQNKPFANLRMKVGETAYVWVKAWGGLFRHFKSEATKGSVVKMTGNLGYQFVGQDEIKLTEITGYDTEQSRVIMKAAVVDEFAGVEDEGEKIDFKAKAASPMRASSAPTADTGIGAEIPF